MVALSACSRQVSNDDYEYNGAGHDRKDAGNKGENVVGAAGHFLS